MNQTVGQVLSGMERYEAIRVLRHLDRLVGGAGSLVDAARQLRGLDDQVTPETRGDLVRRTLEGVLAEAVRNAE